MCKKYFVFLEGEETMLKDFDSLMGEIEKERLLWQLQIIKTKIQKKKI